MKRRTLLPAAFPALIGNPEGGQIMLSKSGIYQIRNTANGKVYVGSSKLLRKRWLGHRASLRRGTHPSRHLQRAWNKYGEASFQFEPLITCAPSMLIWYEQQFIDQLKPEYNSRMLAHSNAGHKYSAESLEKLRVSRADPEWRARMSKIKTGCLHTEDTKLRIRLKMQELSSTPEWSETMRLRHLGRKRPTETRQAISANKTKYYQQPEAREQARKIALEREATARFEFRGESRTITEWAEHTGISVWAIRQRLECGWPIERVLCTRNQKDPIEHNGSRKSLAAWASDYGLKPGTLARRLKAGWDMETALTTPIRDWSAK